MRIDTDALDQTSRNLKKEENPVLLIKRTSTLKIIQEKLHTTSQVPILRMIQVTTGNQTDQ